MNIVELDKYPLSDRNGTYGGQAGSKEGILIDGDYWIVKYPKSTKGMRGPLTSYTTAPLSEYIGSNVYKILGIDVHETMLGIRNDKLVVACKDFCKTEGALREIRTVKNVYNKELNDLLEENLSSTSESHLVDIRDILIHLKYNPVLQNIPNVKNRFWQQIIVDALINNNDRNNGNWGILYENDIYKLAPVFDNGAAFSNKLPDTKLNEYLLDTDKFLSSMNNSRTSYSIAVKSSDNTVEIQPIFIKDLHKISASSFYEAVIDMVPIINQKMNEIERFINDIPNNYKDINVCSEIRKQFYIKSIKFRFDMFLLPLYEKALTMKKNEHNFEELEPDYEEDGVSYSTSDDFEENEVSDRESTNFEYNGFDLGDDE